MTHILLLYQSTDGQTRRITERLAVQCDAHASTQVIDLDTLQPDAVNALLASQDVVVVGASIRHNRYQPQVAQFFKAHQRILQSKKTAFFSVNATAFRADKNSVESNPYVKKLIKTIAWRPDLLAVFAGRVAYPEYSFFNRLTIWLIMLRLGGPRDTSRAHELTNWDKVDDFAQQIIANLG